MTLYSVEEDSGTHFLTMELVEGQSLDRRPPPGGLPPAQVFDVGIALADALAAGMESVSIFSFARRPRARLP